MPPIKPEPGMTYDFKVEDVFCFKNGSMVITGVPSVNLNQLYPATAEVRVNNDVVATITITGELHPASGDRSRQHERSLVTMDKADLKVYLSQGIHIHGTIMEKENAKQARPFMSTLEKQLQMLLADCKTYHGGYKQAALPDGAERAALGQRILAAPVLGLIDTPYSRILLPEIKSEQKSVDERVHLIGKLAISTICDIGARENYNRLLADGMTPEEIDKLEDESLRGGCR